MVMLINSVVFDVFFCSRGVSNTRMSNTNFVDEMFGRVRLRSALERRNGSSTHTGDGIRDSSALLGRG